MELGFSFDVGVLDDDMKRFINWSQTSVKINDKECPGLFEKCFKPATNHLAEEIWLCDEHWQWTMELEAKLRADPELTKSFANAIEKAEAGGLQ